MGAPQTPFDPHLERQVRLHPALPYTLPKTLVPWFFACRPTDILGTTYTPRRYYSYACSLPPALAVCLRCFQGSTSPPTDSMGKS